MDNVLRAQRWSDFRRRADHASDHLYRHRIHSWEYIPIHPFGDESAHLARLGIRAEDCWGVDAWWGVDGDATLLQSSVVKVSQVKPGLYARKTDDEEGWLYLSVVFDLPFVTRQAFEAAMTQFVALGFPDGPLFDLRPEQGCVWLAEVRSAEYSTGGNIP